MAGARNMARIPRTIFLIAMPDRWTPAETGELLDSRAMMTSARIVSCDDPRAVPILRAWLDTAGSARVRAVGRSMWPTIPPGALVKLVRSPGLPSRGSIALVVTNGRLVLHRVVDVSGTAVRTQGDSRLTPDEWISRENVVALALEAEWGGRTRALAWSFSGGLLPLLRGAGARARLRAARVYRALHGRESE